MKSLAQMVDVKSPAKKKVPQGSLDFPKSKVDDCTGGFGAVATLGSNKGNGSDKSHFKSCLIHTTSPAFVLVIGIKQTQKPGRVLRCSGKHPSTFCPVVFARDITNWQMSTQDSNMTSTLSQNKGPKKGHGLNLEPT